MMKLGPIHVARPPWGQSQSFPWGGEGMAETTGESGPGDLPPACVFQPNFMEKQRRARSSFYLRVTGDMAPTRLPFRLPSCKTVTHRESWALSGLGTCPCFMTSPQEAGEELRGPAPWHRHISLPEADPSSPALASAFLPHLPTGVNSLSMLKAKGTASRRKDIELVRGGNEEGGILQKPEVEHSLSVPPR